MLLPDRSTAGHGVRAMTRLLDKLLRRGAPFERTIAPHMDALERMALRLTGNQSDADDLVQDVLTNLYARRHSIEEVDDLQPWLLRVLYRRFVERSRRESPQRDATKETERAEETESEGETPDAVFERMLTAERIQRALDRLSDSHRHLILMHDVEGYSLPEIATIMDVPEGTLKSRLHRARGNLRRELLNLEGGSWPRAS